jgi:hypothetical protein
VTRLSPQELLASQARRLGVWLVLGAPPAIAVVVVAFVLGKAPLIPAVAGGLALWLCWDMTVWYSWRHTVREIRHKTQTGPDLPAPARRGGTKIAKPVASQFQVMTSPLELRSKQEILEQVDVTHGLLRIGLGVTSYRAGVRGYGHIQMEVLRGRDVIATDRGAWGIYLTLQVPAGRYTIKVRCEGHRYASCLLKYQDLPTDAVITDNEQWMAGAVRR